MERGCGRREFSVKKREYDKGRDTPVRSPAGESRGRAHCRRQIAHGEKVSSRRGTREKHADNKAPPRPRRFEKRVA